LYYTYLCPIINLNLNEMLNQVKDLVGKRVKLILMNDDPQTNPIPPNTMGTNLSVDDMDYYRVKWDNGRILNLLPQEDEYEIIENPIN
jgi:hypothetical protein